MRVGLPGSISNLTQEMEAVVPIVTLTVNFFCYRCGVTVIIKTRVIYF